MSELQIAGFTSYSSALYRMPSALLLFRTDASACIGTGHVMRCLSLAQGWLRAGGVVFFAMAEATPTLEQRLGDEGIEFVRIVAAKGCDDDVIQTVELARQRHAMWVVLDGYHFGADYQRGIKAGGLRLLVFDDYGHADHYCADFILNQNLHATADLYRRREPHTRLLLGTRYVLLREQFKGWRKWQREIPTVARKVLVTLGGADPDNVTSKVVEALRGLDIEAKIVAGGSNPHFKELLSVVRPPSSVLHDVTNMPELMAWADIAIAAGGTTSWELAFMGLPSLLIVLAENQRASVKRLAEAGVCFNVGWHSTLSVQVLAEKLKQFASDRNGREGMICRARELVDGSGVIRVINAISGK